MAAAVPFVMTTSLEGHAGAVTGLATCEDQPRLLFSSSRDGTVRVWNHHVQDTEDGRTMHSEVSVLRGHGAPVQDVVIAPQNQGRFAISASSDCTMVLWDMEVSEEVRRFEGHTSDVNSVAFSHDARVITSGSRDNSIAYWNTLAQRKWNEFRHEDCVSRVLEPQLPAEKVKADFGRNLLASASWDGHVAFWDMTLQPPKFCGGHSSAVLALELSPDSTVCFSGDRHGTIVARAVTSGDQVWSLQAAGAVHALACHPRRKWLAAATALGLTIYELKPCERPILEVERPGCLSVKWGDDGNWLYAGFTDGNIHVYDAHDVVIAAEESKAVSEAVE